MPLILRYNLLEAHPIYFLVLINGIHDDFGIDIIDSLLLLSLFSCHVSYFVLKTMRNDFVD